LRPAKGLPKPKDLARARSPFVVFSRCKSHSRFSHVITLPHQA
jgi:hypothetical protein